MAFSKPCQLYLSVFGVFDYQIPGSAPVKLKSRKSEAVLLALALAGTGGLERQQLSGLLWPDLKEDRSKAGLRQALSRIRTLIGNVLYTPKIGWIALDAQLVSCDIWFIRDVLGQKKLPSHDYWPTDSFLAGYPRPTDLFEQWIAQQKTVNKNLLSKDLMKFINDKSNAYDIRLALGQTLLVLCSVEEPAISCILDFLLEFGNEQQFTEVYQNYIHQLDQQYDLKPTHKFIEKYGDSVGLFKARSNLLDTDKKHSNDGYRSKISVTSPAIVIVEKFRLIGETSSIEYLGEAISEALITQLSRHSWFSVRSNNLHGTYKPPGVKAISAKTLRNSYSLTGTVLADSIAVRISVQLTDKNTQEIVWSSQYDKPIKHIPSIQNEIVGKISETLTSQIIASEANQAMQMPSSPSQDIWLNLMKARHLFWRTSRKNNAEARRLLEPIVSLPDPPIAGIVTAVFARLQDVWSGWTDMPDDELADAKKLSEKAIFCAPMDPWAHFTLGTCLGSMGRLTKAKHSLDRAIDLHPNFAAAIGHRGQLFVFEGAFKKGMFDLKTALDLNDLDLHNGLWYHAIGIAEFFMEDYDSALKWANKSIAVNGYWYQNYLLAAVILASLDRKEEALKNYSQVKKMAPNITRKNWHYGHPFALTKHKQKFLDPLLAFGF